MAALLDSKRSGRRLRCTPSQLPSEAAPAHAGRVTQVLELVEDDREQLWQAARDGDLEAYQRRLARLRHGRATRPGQDGPQVPLRVLVAAETEQVCPRWPHAEPRAGCNCAITPHVLCGTRLHGMAPGTFRAAAVRLKQLARPPRTPPCAVCCQFCLH